MSQDSKQQWNNITSLDSEIDDILDSQELASNPQVECPESGDPRLFLTSYSSSLLQHSCLRKFQLRKLGSNARPLDEMTKLTFGFGHSVGAAVVRLLSGESLQTVIFKMFTEWNETYLFSENPKQKKSFFHAVYALQHLQAARQAGLLEEYEPAYLADGRIAAEVSVKIYLPYGYIERAYIDLIMRNKVTGQYCIFENKTSSARYMNSAQYANSMQALGYSLVLNKLAQSTASSADYTVYYLVWLTFLERWEQFEFPKTDVSRAQWIQAKLWDVDELCRVRQQYGDYGMWPLSGEACVSFGRECEFMNECQSHTSGLITPLRQSDIDSADPELDNTGKPWDIVITTDELLAQA